MHNQVDQRRHRLRRLIAGLFANIRLVAPLYPARPRCPHLELVGGVRKSGTVKPIDAGRLQGSAVSGNPSLRPESADIGWRPHERRDQGWHALVVTSGHMQAGGESRSRRPGVQVLRRRA